LPLSLMRILLNNADECNFNKKIIKAGSML
jgi:hypothetical protein